MVRPAGNRASRIGLFATSTELEKLVLSRPSLVSMNDAALKLAPLKNLKESESVRQKSRTEQTQSR